MSVGSIGASIDQLDDSPLYPLGFILCIAASGEAKHDAAGTTYHNANAGETEWVYVKNGTGSTWSTGLPIVRETGTTESNGVLDAPIASAATVPAHRVIGVNQRSFATAKYGFILKRGPGRGLTVTEDIVVDGALVSGNGGIDPMAAGEEHCVIGVALEAQTGNASTFKAFFNCLGC